MTQGYSDSEVQLDYVGTEEGEPGSHSRGASSLVDGLGFVPGEA